MLVSNRVDGNHYAGGLQDAHRRQADQGWAWRRLHGGHCGRQGSLGHGTLGGVSRHRFGPGADQSSNIPVGRSPHGIYARAMHGAIARAFARAFAGYALRWLRPQRWPQPPTAGTLYLTFDTGHGSSAGHCRHTGPTSTKGDLLCRQRKDSHRWLRHSMTSHKTFWQRLVKEGTPSAHTFDHHYFRGDVGSTQVSYVPWGNSQRRRQSAAGVCAELKPEDRSRALTGRGFDGIWRAGAGQRHACWITQLRLHPCRLGRRRIWATNCR